MGCTTSRTGGAASSSGENAQSEEYQTITPDPDLGWRSMPPSLASTLDPFQFVSYVCQNTGRALASETLNSFPIYPSGPRLCFFNDRTGQFFAVDVATLALNMAVRAERLAQKFGVAAAASTSDPPPSDAAGYSANAAAPTSLDSLAEEVHEDAERSSPKIYQILRVPDCGWTLKDREPQSAGASQPAGGRGSRRRRTSLSEQQQQHRASQQAGAKNDADRRALSLEQHLERVGGLKALVDVPSVGMNIAEQLYRLERKTDSSCSLPFSAFGWKVNLTSKLTHRLQVTSPRGELLYLVPEELIMNITQWVQQTYFTSTAF